MAINHCVERKWLSGINKYELKKRFLGKLQWWEEMWRLGEVLCTNHFLDQIICSVLSVIVLLRPGNCLSSPVCEAMWVLLRFSQFSLKCSLWLFYGSNHCLFGCLFYLRCIFCVVLLEIHSFQLFNVSWDVWKANEKGQQHLRHTTQSHNVPIKQRDTSIWQSSEVIAKKSTVMYN